MLSLRELQRAAEVMDRRFRDWRVDKFVEPGPHEIVMVLRNAEGSRDKVPLLLSCRPRFGRVSELGSTPAAPRVPPSFVTHLRSRIGRAPLADISLLAADRLLALGFEAREGRVDLVLALMGPRSNLYLRDASGVILAAQRPLPETRRDLEIGSLWIDPERRIESSGENRFADTAEESWLQAVESHYAPQEERHELESKGRRIALALRKQDAAHRRKQQKLESDLAEGARAGEFERQGELLKGVLGQVRPKATSVSAKDYGTGEEVEIALDPALSASENLNQIFRRQRKAAKKERIAAQEMETLVGRRKELSALQADLDASLAAEDAEALESLASRDEVKRLLSRYAPAPRSNKERVAGPRGPFADLPARLRPRRYRSTDGLEVWVGRSDAGNDHLSTRLARGNDLFLHLEGSPGSHVVLRTAGRSDPPSETLLEACELAVHFSRQKAATRASVHVAAIKDVKKPRGAKPGLVMVYRGRNVDLRRDPERLRRILESQLLD